MNTIEFDKLANGIRAMKTQMLGIVLVVGFTLLLATESKYCISNIVGLVMVYIACRRLNLFYEND